MNDELPMTEVEIKNHMFMFANVMQVAMGIPSTEILRQLERESAIAPFVDPTAYMHLPHDKISQNKRGLRALETFQSEIRKIYPEFA